MNNELLEYHMVETEKKFDRIGKRLEKIETKIDMLISFRLQIIGGSIVASVFITALFQIAVIVMSKT